MRITADNTHFPIRVEYTDPNPWDAETGRRTSTPEQAYAGAATLDQAESAAGHLSAARQTNIRITAYDPETGTWRPYPCIWCAEPINCDRHSYYWTHMGTEEAGCADGIHQAMPMQPLPCPAPVCPAEFWALAVEVIEDGERVNPGRLVERLLRIRYAALRRSDRLFAVENQAALEQHNNERGEATQFMDHYLASIGYCNPGANVCYAGGNSMSTDDLRRYVQGCADNALPIG